MKKHNKNIDDILTLEKKIYNLKKHHNIQKIQ